VKLTITVWRAVDILCVFVVIDHFILRKYSINPILTVIFNVTFMSWIDRMA